MSSDHHVPGVLRLRCPNGHGLKVPAKAAGKKVRCPKEGCGAVFIVPSQMPTAEPGPTGRSSETFTAPPDVTGSESETKEAGVGSNADGRPLLSALGRIPIWLRITGGVAVFVGVFIVGLLIGTRNKSLLSDELVASNNAHESDSVESDAEEGVKTTAAGEQAPSIGTDDHSSHAPNIANFSLTDIVGSWKEGVPDGRKLSIDEAGEGMYSFSIREEGSIYYTFALVKLSQSGKSFVGAFSYTPPSTSGFPEPARTARITLIPQDHNTIQLIDKQANATVTLRRDASTGAALGPTKVAPRPTGPSPSLIVDAEAKHAVDRATAFLPRDSVVVLFASPKRLLASPITKYFEGATKGQIDDSLELVKSRLGVGLEDIDGIFLATDDGEGGAGVVWSRVLFDVPKLVKATNSVEAGSHRNTTIYRMVNSKAYYALPEPAMLVFAASEQELGKALDRAANPDQNADLHMFDTDVDLLIRAHNFEKIFQLVKAKGQTLPKDSEDWAKRISNMMLAVKVRDGLDISFVATMDNQESAQQAAIQLEAVKLLLNAVLTEQIKQNKIKRESPEAQIWSKLLASTFKNEQNQVRYRALLDASLIGSLAKGESGSSRSGGKRQLPDSRNASWQDDFDVFLDELDKVVRAYNNDALGKYAKKTVTWKLKFMAVKETEKGTEIEFDLEPHGILKKAFESRHSVWMSFKPASTALAEWKKLTKGSLVSFQGTVDSAFLFQIEQPVKRNWGIATVGDLKIVEHSAEASKDKANPSDDNAKPMLGRALNDPDLKLLQRSWRADKVYLGPGNVEASAIYGGAITINGTEFRQKEFDANGRLTNFVATITRIDSTKKPKELDLKVKTGSDRGKTIHLVYIVDQNRFEFFRPPVGTIPPKNPWYFGRAGPFMFKDKGDLYQYVRGR